MEEEKINKTMEDYELQQLQEKLETAIKENNQKEITVLRGRIIRELKTKIKSTTGEEKENLENTLKETLEQHKKHLSNRYKEEYSKEKKTIPAIITVLPKGVGLAFKKVTATIEELKLSKQNKEKIFKTIETVKDIIKVPGTVVDFTVRFAVNHWYLLLLLLGLSKNIEANKIKPQEANTILEQSQEAPVQNIEIVPSKVPVEKNVQVPDVETAPSKVPIEDPIAIPKTEPSLDVQEVIAENIKPLTPEESLKKEDIQNKEEILEEMVNDATSKSENVYTVEKQIDTLYKTYSESIKETTMCDSFPTLKEAIEYYQENGGMTYEEAKRVVTDPNNSIRIISGDGGIFSNEEEFVDYMTNGEGLQDIDLGNESVEEYLNNLQSQNTQVDFELFKSLSPDAMIETAKEIGPVGVTLLILYEGMQYGLAPVTGGASLILPG